MNRNVKSISFTRGNGIRVLIAYAEDPDEDHDTKHTTTSYAPCRVEFEEAFDAFAWIAVRLLNMRPEFTQKAKPLPMTMRMEATELFTVKKVIFDKAGVIIVGKSKPHEAWQAIHCELPPIPIYDREQLAERPNEMTYVEDIVNHIDDLSGKAETLKHEAMCYLAAAHERQLTLFSPYEYEEAKGQSAALAG